MVFVYLLAYFVKFPFCFIIISFAWYREFNQIILKYAIYENKDFKDIDKIDIKEITENKITWYAKFKDNTIQKIDKNQASRNSWF